MKTVIAALSLLFVAVVAPCVGQGDDDNSRQTLAGLTGVYVGVDLTTNGSQPNGLTETQLRTDVELKLRQAGIKVLSTEDVTRTPGVPFLFVKVSTLELRGGAGLYSFSIGVELLQAIQLARNPSVSGLGRTWNANATYGTFGSGKLGEEVRRVVRDLTDQFINAYLAANPKR